MALVMSSATKNLVRDQYCPVTLTSSRTPTYRPSVSKAVEQDHGKLLNNAVFSFGNAHSNDEKMTLYVYGLSNTIYTVVVRYREVVHRRHLPLGSLCHYARSEDAYHAHFMNFACSLPTNQACGVLLPSPSIESSRATPRSQKNVVTRRQSPITSLGSEQSGDGKNEEPIMVVKEEENMGPVDDKVEKLVRQVDEQHELLL